MKWGGELKSNRATAKFASKIKKVETYFYSETLSTPLVNVFISKRSNLIEGFKGISRIVFYTHL